MSPFEEEEKIFCEIHIYIFFFKFYGQQDFKQKDQKSVHLVLSFNLLCLQALSVIVGLQKYIFLYFHNFVLLDPGGAGHVEAFQLFSVSRSVGGSVGPLVGLSFRRLVCPRRL